MELLPEPAQEERPGLPCPEKAGHCSLPPIPPTHPGVLEGDPGSHRVSSPGLLLFQMAPPYSPKEHVLCLAAGPDRAGTATAS